MLDHVISKDQYTRLMSGETSGLPQRILRDINLLRKATTSGRAHLILLHQGDNYHLGLWEVDLVPERPPFGRVVIL